MNTKPSIRIAITDDYQLIADFGARTFYETWRPVNTEGDMQIYLKKAFDPEIIRRDLENSKVNTFLLASIGEKTAGYVKMRRDRTYDEFDGAKVIEIERIYIDQNIQRTGIGSVLMDECIRIAEEEKNEWLWLGVNIDNIKAINFYKKYGFTIFGEKAFQLGDAVDNDYLMKLKLPV